MSSVADIESGSFNAASRAAERRQLLKPKVAWGLGRLVGIAEDFFSMSATPSSSIAELDLRLPVEVLIVRPGKKGLTPGQLPFQAMASRHDPALEVAKAPAADRYPG